MAAAMGARKMNDGFTNTMRGTSTAAAEARTRAPRAGSGASIARSPSYSSAGICCVFQRRPQRSHAQPLAVGDLLLLAAFALDRDRGASWAADYRPFLFVWHFGY